ncbi:hypothetical protein QUN99_003371 [Vibrio parahaemolyticus]|nr:hypothetical protein [Vibrio parahaemolyticus]
MMKIKVANRMFIADLEKLQSRYRSLLVKEYLLEEIALCERILADYPEIADSQYQPIVTRSPVTLANSARLLLLSDRKNKLKHQTLPLFNGWSKLEIERATTLSHHIPEHVKTAYVEFEHYQKHIGSLDKEMMVEID